MILDWLNIALILGCCALAYRYPVELGVFSTVILGPAHFLTELSWLHDRDYFTIEKTDAVALAALSAAALIERGNIGDHCLWAAFALAAVAALLPRERRGRWTAPAAALAGFLIGPRLGFFWTAVLPTAVHVFAFTALFILAGAVKRKSAAGILSAAVLLACGASFFYCHPFAEHPVSGLFLRRSRIWFAVYTPLLARLGVAGRERLFGVLAFLSFAYTYHYLNWFSKVELIRWHRVPGRRWMMLAAAYGLLLAVFCWDFDAGLSATALLSIAHVGLEFPLDFRTAAGLFSPAYRA